MGNDSQVIRDKKKWLVYIIGRRHFLREKMEAYRSVLQAIELRLSSPSDAQLTYSVDIYHPNYRFDKHDIVTLFELGDEKEFNCFLHDELRKMLDRQSVELIRLEETIKRLKEELCDENPDDVKTDNELDGFTIPKE